MQKQYSKCRIGMSTFTRELLSKTRMVQVEKIGDDGVSAIEEVEEKYTEWSAWEETKHPSISKAKKANGRESTTYESVAVLPQLLLQYAGDWNRVSIDVMLAEGLKPNAQSPAPKIV